MKKIVLLLLVISAPFSNYGQKGLSSEYSYSVSEPYQVYDASKKFYLSEKNQILSMKPYKKSVVVLKFDVGSLKLISTKEYEDFPDNYVVEGMKKLQDKYYLFYSSWTGRKTQHEQLFYREINFDTGEFVGEAVKLIDIDGRLTGTMASTGGFGFGIADKFDFLTS